MERVKSILWLFCCMILLLGLVLVSDAAAFGIGFYGGGGAGSGEVEMDPNNSSSNYTFNVDNTHANFGLVLDTAVAKDTVFNYRLSLGYESFTSKDKTDEDLNLAGLVIDNDFGFGVVRGERVRVWLGPELRISFLSGEFMNRYDYSQFGIGVGPVVGINLNLGDAMALGFKVGYLFNSYGGEVSGKTNTVGDATYTMTEGLPHASIALILRLGSD